MKNRRVYSCLNVFLFVELRGCVGSRVKVAELFFCDPFQAEQPLKPEQNLLGDTMPFGNFVPNGFDLPVLGLIRVDPKASNRTPPFSLLGQVEKVVKLRLHSKATFCVVKHVECIEPPPSCELLFC